MGMGGEEGAEQKGNGMGGGHKAAGECRESNLIN
jgi:hypothetical protein